MSENNYPILYSFRRCPYAMRARLAICVSQQTVELREILLKDKPQAMLQASPKGTVPVLILQDNTVIEESREIMHWALEKNDPHNWFTQLSEAEKLEINELIDENDNEFKAHLDKYKYATRFPEHSETYYRQQGETFLSKLDNRLNKTAMLCGDQPTLADFAIFPFVRQFAFVDMQWFENSEYYKLKLWLTNHLESEIFQTVIQKFEVWSEDNKITLFQ